MGAYVKFSNRIEFNSQKLYVPTTQYTFDEMNEKIIDEIIQDEKVEVIQISEYLSDDKLAMIDKILKHRKDIIFRIYGFYSEGGHCDLSFLSKMKYISKLCIDYLRNVSNLDVIKDMKLHYLRFYVFDLKDYQILKEIPDTLEELRIMHEASAKAIFDGSWLLRFKNLHTLYVGRVPKNIECIKELKSLHTLTLRGMNLDSLAFLEESNVENLKIHWCSMKDLSSLSHNTKITSLELWRIMKLEDLSFISTLKNLEEIFLQDLSNIISLPELKNTKVKAVSIDNVKNIKDIQSLVECKELERLFIFGSKYIEMEDFKALFEKESLKSMTIRGIGNKKRSEQIQEWMNVYHKKELDEYGI